MTRPSYPATMMHQACVLRAGGFNSEQIAAILARDNAGDGPSPRTILRWTDPDHRARDYERATAAHRRTSAQRARFRLPSRTDEYREAFIRRLRAEGVPRTSIAKVCGVVFGASFSRHDIAVVLGEYERRAA